MSHLQSTDQQFLILRSPSEVTRQLFLNSVFYIYHSGYEEAKTRGGAEKKSSKVKKLKMILQTSQDINNIKTQLKAMLNTDDKNSIENNRNPEGTNVMYDDINQTTADERDTLNQFANNEQNTMSELAASGGNGMNDASGGEMVNEFSLNGRNAANEQTPSGQDTAISEFTDDRANTINELTANGEATMNQIPTYNEDSAVQNYIGNGEATMNQIAEYVGNDQNSQAENNPLEYRLQQFKKRNRFYKPKKSKKKSQTPS